MKVSLLVLLFFCGTVALAFEVKTRKSKLRPGTSGGSTAIQDNWSRKRTELVTQLKQVYEAAKQSNDAELRRRANVLSGSVTTIIAELNISKERGNLEERVKTLVEQLSSPVKDPNGRTDPKLAATRAELARSVDHAISRAESVVAENERPDLKLRFARLRHDSKNLKVTIAAAMSDAELDQAREELKTLEDESSSIVNDASHWGISTDSVLGAAGICLGFISIILLLITTLHLTNRLTLADVRETKSVEPLTKKISEVTDLISSIEQNISKLQSDLGLQIAAAQRSSEEAMRRASLQDRLPPITPNVSESVVPEIDSRPTFPSLVSDYLSRIGDPLKKAVETDFITNTLVQASTQAAPFMLIAEQGAADGYVLPKPRLQRGQDFSQFYKSYYVCAEPSAGEVYIVRPARVAREGNRWRLQEMGKMEIH